MPKFQSFVNIQFVVKISQRAGKLPASPIRKLIPFANIAKKKGIKIYHLNIGQPDIASPELFLQKIKQFPHQVLAYEQSDGNLQLRQSASIYYKKCGIDLKTEDIIITQGGSEALWMACFILLEPRQECLTIEPFYANYLSFAGLADIKITAVTSKIEDNFQLPAIAKIKAAVTPKTKAILLCSPSNPTGVVYTKKDLTKLVDFCLQKNIFIISDETYREFFYGKVMPTSLMAFKKAHQQIVVIDSFSKRFSLCGARLGIIASKNKDIMAAVLKMAQARLAAPTIEQYAASFLHQVPQKYFKAVQKEYQKRRDTLVSGLQKIPGVKCGIPSGAFYLIAELPVDNTEKFAEFLLKDFSYQKETVMVAPAQGFYTTPNLGKKQVRIAYVLNCEDLEKSCMLLGKALEKYNKK